ncbi:hypothetical protein ODJ79_32775 [Actinoplanes sp. KI2]|uniref:hypothetical protein n=1 Tax=Actinoplanes sp. KI2 TaxID=2983315 RepID=UPI0021D5D8A7|nr:hypothetical protein [Actinoplanes sp. KI2]MCU7728511.1 hypothetical protein [Actinoplanes sp. KI2]
MTVRRGSTVVAVVALVAAVAAVLVTFGRAGLGSGATPSPAAVAPPVVVDSTWPSPSVAAVHSTTPTPPAVPSAGASPKAAPFVQHFGDGTTASPLPKQKSPTAPLKVPAFVDGCDHHYGTPTQCVPLVFPAGVAGTEGKCAWLAAHGFTDLIVAGKDSQGLDADGDGVACD